MQCHGLTVFLLTLFRFYITDFVVKASWSLYCFTSSVPHGVKNYFPRLWGMIIFNAISILFIKRY